MVCHLLLALYTNSYTRAILDSKKEEEQQRQSGAGAGAGAAVSPSKRSHYGLRTDTATKDAFIAYYKKVLWIVL